jgi:murein tripeptide amidase MpaA
MKLRLILFVFILCAVSFTASATERYAQIRIFVEDRTDLGRIWAAGVDHEGASGKPGGWMEFVVGEAERRNLEARGIPYETVVYDLTARYVEKAAIAPRSAEGFGSGSLSGHYSFSEVVSQLDSMALLYPALVSPKQAIGTTQEGRTLWAVKISDNPLTNEPAEPEVLYTALHHAREPGGMMSAIYYMWWLLENYNSNPEATYLVNNRQMWFIPVVNPDGYVWNQTIAPSGGGLWRKNRRVNSPGIYGVDLNRNYGPYAMWNSSNGGSSTTPSDDTYRGTAPFSEPEILAMDNFMRAHNFRAALNYHTYSNLLVYPYGYTSAESSDSLIYREWAYAMTANNHYTSGTDLQTVNYATRGNSDDYMFGDTTKPRTFAMTPEVGTSGFWAQPGEILQLVSDNLLMNKLLSYYGGYYPDLRGYEIVDSGGDGYLTRGETFSISASIRNIGLATAYALPVTMSSSLSSVHLSTPTIVLDSLPKVTTINVSFQGFVDSDAETGLPLSFVITYNDGSGFPKQDTIHMYLGTPSPLLVDNASGGLGNWSPGTWGTISDAHTPPLAFTDSPGGRYPLNANNALTSVAQYSLFGNAYAELRFWTKWSIEPTFDFATVEISTNNGSSWSTLRTPLSHTASARSTPQPAGTYGYDGYTPGLTWIEQAIDLSGYISKTLKIKLRFRLASDGGDNRDGFYVDDIRLLGYQSEMVQATPPELHLPTDGSSGLPPSLVLTWHPGLRATTYDLQVAHDPGFTMIVREDSLIADTTFGISGLDVDSTYYWRVRSRNSYGISAWTEPGWAFATGLLTANYEVLERWNIVSLPLTMSDHLVTSVFADAISQAYGFLPGSGYAELDTLSPGSGYWLKFPAAETVAMVGYERGVDTLQLSSGWNLIGATSRAVATTAIEQDPPGIITGAFYGYDGAYEVATTLVPAHGYWVKAGSEGNIILRSGIPGPGQEDERVLPEQTRELIFVDGTGASISLYATGLNVTPRTQGFFELPPEPPAGAFDVRFETNSSLALFPAGSCSGCEARITVKSAQSPLTIRWVGDSLALVLIADRAGHRHTIGNLTGTGSMTFADTIPPEFIIRTAAHQDELPTRFALGQNYPNPFNPATTIRYDIPENSIASVRMFNLLGQEIAAPVPERMHAAGTYMIQIDGSALNSGVYFIRLQATTLLGGEPVTIMKKVTLLK